MSVVDLKPVVYLLVLLNPFAQVIYVWDLMKEKTGGGFPAIYGRASLLTYGVFLLFAFTGEWLLEDVFQVALGSFQVFGGLIMVAIGYRYILDAGKASGVNRVGSDLAPNVAIPFMIGPATVWESIVIGKSLPFFTCVIGIGAVLIANWVFVAGVARAVGRLEGYRDTLVGKYFGVLMRTNALFIGAIGVEMILAGLKQYFMAPQ